MPVRIRGRMPNSFVAHFIDNNAREGERVKRRYGGGANGIVPGLRAYDDFKHCGARELANLLQLLLF